MFFTFENLLLHFCFRIVVYVSLCYFLFSIGPLVFEVLGCLSADEPWQWLLWKFRVSFSFFLFLHVPKSDKQVTCSGSHPTCCCRADASRPRWAGEEQLRQCADTVSDSAVRPHSAVPFPGLTAAGFTAPLAQVAGVEMSDSGAKNTDPLRQQASDTEQPVGATSLLETSELEEGHESRAQFDDSGLCTQLQSGLESLRVEQSLTDVTLHVEGREFPCHRVVLAAGSHYFRWVLSMLQIRKKCWEPPPPPLINTTLGWAYVMLLNNHQVLTE